MPLHDIAIDGHRVMAIGDAGAVASTDGSRFYPRPSCGATQRAIVAHDGVFHVLAAAVRPSSYAPWRGFAPGRSSGGEGVLAATRDLGTTWRRFEFPTRLGVEATAIYRDDDGFWWLTFPDGSVITSRKLAHGWRLLRLPRPVPTEVIYELDGYVVFAGETCMAWNGHELRVLQRGPGDSFARVLKSPDDAWLAFAGETLARSRDHGRIFKPVLERETPGVLDWAWVAGALFVIGPGGTLWEWSGERFERRRSPHQLRAIASWGDGALLCSRDGNILHLASPNDPYWRGAIDQLATPPPRVEPRPVPAMLDERDAVYRDLVRESTLVHDELSAPLRAAAPRSHIEQIIDDSEGDLEAFRVYVDALHDRDDPRAELAAVQLALATTPSIALKVVETELVAADDRVLGSLRAVLPLLAIDWRGGFPWRVTVHSLPALLTLLQDPHDRFLHTLEVEHVARRWDPYVAALAARYRPTLRALTIGRLDNDSQLDLEPLYAAVPNLRTLTIAASHITLGEVVLPRLERFSLSTTGLVSRAARAIASARWPSLEALSIHVGARRRGGTAKLGDLRPIFDAAGLPRLRHLAIRSCELSDALVKVLATSALLPQLTTLDLRSGTLSDAGARTLFQYQHAFAHLGSIDLANNIVTPAGRALLAATALRTQLSEQRPDAGPRVLP